MKKLISILLVAMLIISLFPATAMAADTEVVFNLGANGSASHADGSSKTTYSATVDGYTLSITGGTNMYTGARDAKGNSCIKLGTGSKAGSFTISGIPADVTSVVICVAKYKANAATVTVNGTATVLTKASNDGAYDEITVDTTATKTISLSVSSGKRAMVNTITFIIPAAEGACEHPNAELVDNTAKDATCTESGKYADQYCPDCGETIEGEAIDALGHNFVDGVCDRTDCGYVATIYTLATSATTLKAGDKVLIVAAESNYAMGAQTNNNRGQVAITKTGNQIFEPSADVQVLTLEAGKQADTFAFSTGSGYLYAASSSSNYLRTEATLSDNSSWSISIDDDGVATVIAQGTNTRNMMQYNKSSGLFAAYASAQQKMSLYVLPAAAEETPVVEMDGEQYSSFEEAYAVDPDTTIKLLASIEDIDVSGDLYLDLNGFTASVTNANGVYVFDSTATATEEGDGVLIVENAEEVITDYTANNKRYIALKDGNNYTFHVLELALTNVTLRTTAAGIYYKAKVVCDSTLLSKITNYGVLLSTKGVPTAFDDTLNAWTTVANQGEKALTSGAEFTSGSVFGIFKDGKDNADRGTKDICANAYITLEGDRTLLTAKSAAVSMKTVITAVNNMNFSTMKPELYNSLDAFYDQWADVLESWGMDNMSDAFGS